MSVDGVAELFLCISYYANDSFCQHYDGVCTVVRFWENFSFC